LESWLDFWNAPQRLYVNPEHAARLYREIAEELVRAAGISQGARCLDFGCGEALGCPVLLARGASVLLYDPAPRMRHLAGQRFAGEPGVSLLETSDFEAIPRASLDVIAVISVVQYLPREELRRLLGLWRRQLRASGRLVLGDVIPPHVGAVSDTVALFTYCGRRGNLLPALLSVAATAFSDYRRVRRALGLTSYDEAELRSLLSAHGFDATRHPHNMGINQARMTFVCRCTEPGRTPPMDTAHAAC
jgi:SAM-dependent methyltransferase